MSVFQRGGQKTEHFLADDKVDYEAIRQEKLQGLLDLWSQPRVGSHLSAAIWRHQHKLAEVVVSRGRVLERMGFVHKGHTYLYIEEAVYLIDRGDLLLIVELDRQHGRPLPLAEAFELMHGCGVPLPGYQVYCHLRRAGYAVTRSPATWCVPHAAPLPPGTWEYRTPLPAGATLPPSSTAQHPDVAAEATDKQQQHVGQCTTATAGTHVEEQQEHAEGPDSKRRRMLPVVSADEAAPATAASTLSNLAAEGGSMKEKQTDAVVGMQSGLQTHFDAVAPCTKSFSRKNPPAVTFSVVLTNQVPSLLELKTQQGCRGGDAPPLKYATVNQGDVAFMELTVLALPHRGNDESYSRQQASGRGRERSCTGRNSGVAAPGDP